MKQHRLYTSIYIVGTGLSIAFTMTLFIIFHIKYGDIYPEYNRDRTMVIKQVKKAFKKDQGNIRRSHASLELAELARDQPHLEALAVTSSYKDLITTEAVAIGQKVGTNVFMLRVDEGFWKVFSLQFIAGKPFDASACATGLPLAVISRSLAERLFAETDVVGREFLLAGETVKVAGVVRDVSAATPVTAADIYLPLMYDDPERFKGKSSNGTPLVDIQAKSDGLMGKYKLYLLAVDKASTGLLHDEVIEAVKKYNDNDPVWDTSLYGQPDIYWKSTLRTWKELDVNAFARTMLYMLLALLFIPAINLCGMTSSRMEERMSELGVRKAYGATNGELFLQMLTENFLITLLGGVVGLALSYLIVYTGSDWVLYLFDKQVLQTSVLHGITPEMLFSPVIFLIVLGVCFLLNFISVVIPTALALKHSIIQSIQTKR